MELEGGVVHPHRLDSSEETMIRRQEGFTIVELLVTMLIFVIAIAATSNVFVGLLGQFKQQSKVAETNIEGAVGLEMMRRDLVSAGFGLPWDLHSWGTVSYNESAAAPFGVTGLNDSTTIVPRGIFGKNNAVFGADYLVIKAVNVATNDASKKWTYVRSGNVLKIWNTVTDTVENLANGNGVIVVNPGTADNPRRLRSSGGVFATTYNAGALANAALAPTDPTDTYIVYGLDNAATIRMPFNRADYYVRQPADIPNRCAPNTGVLYKATLNHANGEFTEFPILDCVADMQVIFRLDMNGDGIIGTNSDAEGAVVNGPEGAAAGDVAATLQNASLLRQRVKEVRVYILAHEGQEDPSYDHSPVTIHVGDAALGTTLGRDFNIGANIRYRWKLYTIVVKTSNLEK